MPQTKVVENIKTHTSRSGTFSFSKIVPLLRECGKLLQSPTGHRWKYDACEPHAGYKMLQTHTH